RALRSRSRTRPRHAGGAGSRLRARMRRDPAAGRGRDVSPSRLNYTIGARLQRETSEPDGEPAEHRARIPERALEVASHLARAESHPVRCLADGDRPHLRMRREVDDADEVGPTV